MASIRVEFDVEMPMRDGVMLRGDIFRPSVRSKVPAVVCRTPYDKSARKRDRWFPAVESARAGFAVVYQDTRGRFTSDGEWHPMDWGGGERFDGYDTVEWLAAQPWCDGNVGMFGGSYEAGNQIAAAIEHPPHLRAIAPSLGGVGYDGVRRSSMALETIVLGWTAMMAVDVIGKRAARGEDTGDDLAKVMSVMADPAAAAWTLPLQDLPPLQVAGMPSYEGITDIIAAGAGAMIGNEDRIEVPVLFTTGWYDIGVGTWHWRTVRERAATELARTESKLIIGPWGHTAHDHNMGEWGFGMFAALERSGVVEGHRHFFSRHLRGDDAAPGLANVRYFVMGANAWKESPTWPPPGTEIRPSYLHSGGGANTAAGDGTLTWDPPTGEEPADSYDYDPAHPVRSFGLRVMYNGGSTVHGPFDQARIERRDDVVVYTSAPLEAPMEIAGDVELRVFVSSSAPDTDFVPKLCDVDAEGISCNIADGFARARYRDSWESPTPLEEGKTYELTIDLGPVAHRFAAGHCVRLQLTSSCFPHWDRNMNTGNPPGTDAGGVIAHQTVHHSSHWPSLLLLPVVP